MDKVYKLRRIADAQPDEVLGSCVRGIDEEPASGWVWQPPQTPEEVDRLVMERQAIIDRISANIADLHAIKAGQQAIMDRIVADYAHLFPAPAAGGSWKDYRGPYSGGNYRNQPERAPEIRLKDKELAKHVGALVEVKSWRLAPDRIRQSIAAGATPYGLGVELIARPAVSFSPRKFADNVPTTHHSDE